MAISSATRSLWYATYGSDRGGIMNRVTALQLVREHQNREHFDARRILPSLGGEPKLEGLEPGEERVTFGRQELMGIALGLVRSGHRLRRIDLRDRSYNPLPDNDRTEWLTGQVIEGVQMELPLDDLLELVRPYFINLVEFVTPTGASVSVTRKGLLRISQGSAETVVGQLVKVWREAEER